MLNAYYVKNHLLTVESTEKILNCKLNMQSLLRNKLILIKNPNRYKQARIKFLAPPRGFEPLLPP